MKTRTLGAFRNRSRTGPCAPEYARKARMAYCSNVGSLVMKSNLLLFVIIDNAASCCHTRKQG